MTRTALLAAVIAGVVAQGGPGSLDPTFGNHGRVVTNVGVRCDQYAPGSGTSALAHGPGGKIVVAGWSWDGCSLGYRFAVVRFGRNGSLDRSFGVDGRVSSGPNRDASLHAVAVRPDGKIVGGGWTSADGSDSDFALTRYFPNGTVDRRFGDEGLASLPLPGSQEINAIALAPDGEILAAGRSGNDFALFRFSSRGELDPSFGKDGILMTPVGDGPAAVMALRRLANGKLLVAGVTGGGRGSAALARYTEDGELDPSFGSDGIVLLPSLSSARAIVVEPNRKIVVAGDLGGAFALARLTPTGALDSGFGLGGFARQPFGSGSAAFDVARQRDGRLVVAGSARSDFAVVRYRHNGRLDPTFGRRGRIVAHLTYGYDVATAVVIQHGKILVAGTTYDDSFGGGEGDTNGRITLLRYRG
jgi:uncharacterized delta-60 repeat protein